jgi:hypothetical protein
MPPFVDGSPSRKSTIHEDKTVPHTFGPPWYGRTRLVRRSGDPVYWPGVVGFAVRLDTCGKPRRNCRQRGSGSTSWAGDEGGSRDSGSGSKGGPMRNNGAGNGEVPQPPGNPPVNDGPDASPGNPDNKGGENEK